MSGNHTANSTFDIYLRKLMIYVAKNPGEFVSYGRSKQNYVDNSFFCQTFFQIHTFIKLYNILLFTSYSVSFSVATDADLWISFMEANSDDGSRKEGAEKERYYNKQFA